MAVIDADQGVTDDGVERRGFDGLVAAVCRGEVGLVLSLEASRLARNGRDWHTLLDFCAIVRCLVGDRQRLYDPGLAVGHEHAVPVLDSPAQPVPILRLLGLCTHLPHSEPSLRQNRLQAVEELLQGSSQRAAMLTAHQQDEHTQSRQ